MFYIDKLERHLVFSGVFKFFGALIEAKQI